MYTIKEREHARRITDVPSDARRPGVRYRPGCRCGWQRRPVRLIEQAKRACRQHPSETTAAW